ncbi:MAG: PAS domain S-box protein, partial [Bdellovibrionales bacterium]|nr:PAS domain S-box protein [Bdellovibrionales bacterium]
MLDRATPFRAYVVGSPENRKDFLELAGDIANDRIVFCFDDEEHHQSETTSGPNSASGNRPPEGAIDAQQLWDSTGFYCVLYLARNADIRDVKSEGLSAFLHRFESFTRQGVPTFLVPLDGPPSSTIRSEADGIARPVVSDLESRAENCSNTTTKLIHVEQLVHRLGGAGLVYPSDIPNLDVFLKNSLQTHYENEAILQDIRDAESYLQKLRQSELRYRNLVQMSRDLIWSVDVEGRWTFVNDAVINILGYTPKEMIGRRFTEFQDPKDASKDLVTFSKVLEGQKYFDYETCYLAKQGFRVVLSFNALVAFDEEGTPIGATGTAIDVTARKRAAEELKKQKEFFRQVVDANPNRIAVRNLAGQFVLANRAFANSLRYDADDLVGLKYDEIISEERALKLIARHDQQLIANPAQEIVFERRERSRHNGSGRWVQTTRKTLNISNHPDPFLLEVGVDLTERKRSEEALRHVIEGTAGVTAEEYFPSLLEHLAAALQMHAGIIYGTDEVEAHFRVLARFPDSLTYTDLQLPYDNPLFEKLLRENFILLTEGADEMMPAALRGHFSVLLGTILRDTRGESIGMLLVVGDNFNDNPDFAEYLLTLFGERASAELARIKNEKETKKLERQLQQAQKMEAIGTLAAGIAHDLNNALGAVAGHLQLLEGGPSISTEDKRSLHIALDGCSRASRLVHQLLGFSRRGNYVPERINLRELLSEMVEFLNCATRKDIDVAVSDVTDAFI